MKAKDNIISDLFSAQEGNMPYEQTIRLVIYAVIGITLIILIVIGLKWLIRKVKNDDVVSSSKKEIRNNDLSFSDFTYKQMAASIFEAADGIGTDEDTIYRNLNRLQTRSDWYKLINTYRVDKDGFNLVSRLIYELDDSEKDKVNEILSKFNESI